MQKLSRRHILKLGAGAAIALGASQVLTGCSEEEKRPESTATPEPKARVAAVHGEDLYAMTRQALEAMGGMAAIVRSGETVFIKPNFVTMPFANRDYSPFLKGECAKVEIITTVAEECLKAGASKVTIGDGSQMPSFDWNYATTLDGSTDIVQEAKRLNAKYGEKVTLACLDIDTPDDDWVEVPSSSKPGTIAISGLVAHADRVISIPVMKSHSWAQLTLSLKNFRWGHGAGAQRLGALRLL
jgi:uncharacterized protein (DUF362 family)